MCAARATCSCHITTISNNFGCYKYFGNSFLPGDEQSQLQYCCDHLYVLTESLQSYWSSCRRGVGHPRPLQTVLACEGGQSLPRPRHLSPHPCSVSAGVPPPACPAPWVHQTRPLPRLRHWALDWAHCGRGEMMCGFGNFTINITIC